MDYKQTQQKPQNCKLQTSTFNVSPNPNIFLSPFLVLPLLEWNTIPLEQNVYVMLESLGMKLLRETMKASKCEMDFYEKGITSFHSDNSVLHDTVVEITLKKV